MSDHNRTTIGLRLDEHSPMSSSSTYPEDYERLVKLIPSNGKSDTLGGEIMRAVKQLSAPQGIRVLESINFLTKFGIVSEDETDLYANLDCLDERISEPTERKKLALETLADRAKTILYGHTALQFARVRGICENLL